MSYHKAGYTGGANGAGVDMARLSRPRGKGYSLRMQTPKPLVGRPNPWTGRQFGKTIILGLGTRIHAEAVRRRDLKVGEIRRLEEEARGKTASDAEFDFSEKAMKEWRELRAEHGDRFDLVLSEQLDRATDAGYGREARRFADVVLKGRLPLQEALEAYLLDRSPGNPLGLDELKPATMADVRSSVKHLVGYLGEGATLTDLTPNKAFEFTTRYLPDVAKVSAKTVAKHNTHLRGLWMWAITDRRILRDTRGRPNPNPWVSEEKGVSRKKANKKKKGRVRSEFKPEEVSALFEAASDWGSREADIIRLVFATGVRADEIASLELKHVQADGTGFRIPEGKTESATRYIPLVGAAQRLMEQRVAMVNEMQRGVAEGERRLFPEWPQRPSNGKASALSQWFTRFRRDVLGAETNGRLVLHSFRHTWATIAKRAGLPRDVRQELGGWAKGSTAMEGYEHGLGNERLTECQGRVWSAFEEAGYLKAF